ncbi:hypothetical protein ACLOJK_016653 [Asimina triloba]
MAFYTGIFKLDYLFPPFLIWPDLPGKKEVESLRAFVLEEAEKAARAANERDDSLDSKVYLMQGDAVVHSNLQKHIEV